MKKTIIIVALTLSGNVFAGQYTDAVITQNICDSSGKAGILGYKARLSHKPVSYIDNQLGPEPEDVHSFKHDAWANVRAAGYYGYNEASDEKDAYQMAWASCMDKDAEGKEEQAALDAAVDEAESKAKYEDEMNQENIENSSY